MTNLVIDTPNMFYRSMFVTGLRSNERFTFNSKDQLAQLARKVAIDVTYVIRMINPSRVVFTFDSRSWRKDISIDENEGYKGNREKDSYINWDNVFALMSEFEDILDEKGFIVSHVDNAEADDLISMWADFFIKEKSEHVVLVSADEDVRQKVQTLNNKHCIVFNPFMMGRNAKRKMYVPSGFNEWLSNDEETGDFFNRGIDMDKGDFNRLSMDKKVQVEEVDGNEISLRKFFCGDDGDNVPAIYTWIGNNSKGIKTTYRITNSKAIKIIDNLGISDHTQLLEKAGEIHKEIQKICKHEPAFKPKKRVERQLQLVVLDQRYFPKEIRDEFEKERQKVNKVSDVHPQNWNMNLLLEGTSYVGKEGRKTSGSESDIFSKIDKINKLF